MNCFVSLSLFTYSYSLQTSPMSPNTMIPYGLQQELCPPRVAAHRFPSPPNGQHIDAPHPPLPLEILERIFCFCDRPTLVRCFRVNHSIGNIAVAFTYHRVSYCYNSDWLHPVRLTCKPDPL